MRNTGRPLMVALAAGAVLGLGPCSPKHDDEHSSHEEHHHFPPDGGLQLFSPFNPTAPACGLTQEFDAGVLTDVVPGACIGGDVLVAPQLVQRAPGPPQEVRRPFSMTPGGDVCVELQNSGVASASVELDDRDVFRPSDFNPVVTHLTSRKMLGAGDHVLDMKVRSAPGSSITVSVLRALMPPPLPSGVLAQGPVGLLQLTAINADPRGISPRNEDGNFDTTALSAALRVLVPQRFAREPQEHTYRVEYTWKVANNACTIVRSIKSTLAIPLPSVPSGTGETHSSSSSRGEDGDHDGHGGDNGNPGNDHHDGEVSSSSSSSRTSSSSRAVVHPPDNSGMLWAPFSVTGTWDGKDDGGAWVLDGTYEVFLEALVIRTDLENDDDDNGNGVPDHNEIGGLPGTSHVTEPPEQHLVDGLVSPFVPVLVDNTPPTVTVQPLPRYTNASTMAVIVTAAPLALIPMPPPGVVQLLVVSEAFANVRVHPAQPGGPDGVVRVPAIPGFGSTNMTLAQNQLNAFEVTAADALLNVSTPPITASTIHDNIKPVVTILGPAAGAIPSDHVDVTGTAVDANPLDNINVTDGTTSYPGGVGPDFNVTVALSTDGSKTITVNATDLAGNTGTDAVTVHRAPQCTTSADCPPPGCGMETNCNPSGFCEVITLGGPPPFCTIPDGGQEKTNLWTWGCTTTDAGATRWTCGFHASCGAQVGCFTSHCVQGEGECVQQPVSDGVPCAVFADGGVPTAPHCQDEFHLARPTCIGGQCITGSSLAVVDCRDIIIGVDLDCVDARCQVVGGTATCVNTNKTAGTLCGPCAVPGSAGPSCDACGKPYVCAAGLCGLGNPPRCPNPGVCQVGFCDPFTGLCGNQPRVCPSGAACDPTLDGGCR